MNFINANFVLPPRALKEILLFCSENTYQHITSLEGSAEAAGAALEPFFKESLDSSEAAFRKIHARAGESTDLKQLSSAFMTENDRLIAILERIKFENLGGYPIVYQNIFHYLYEQRYFNALLLNNRHSAGVLITTSFNAEFKLSKTYLLYNNIYFWSIIGGMHPGILLANGRFASVVTPAAAVELADFRTAFNAVCFRLTSSRSRLNAPALSALYADFLKLNSRFLALLHEINDRSARVFKPGAAASLPPSFFDGVKHMIAEHTAISEIGKTDLSSIKIPG